MRAPVKRSATYEEFSLRVLGGNQEVHQLVRSRRSGRRFTDIGAVMKANLRPPRS